MLAKGFEWSSHLHDRWKLIDVEVRDEDGRKLYRWLEFNQHLYGTILRTLNL